MCAVWGFIARNYSRPRINTLKRIVEANISRGPHAFGFAWIDHEDRIHMFKQTGRLTDDLAILALAANARMLIGHLRYATHGSPADNMNNHPHPSDGGWIVHNGIIQNDRELVEDHNLSPLSQCDSELLGLLIERGEGALTRRCIEAVKLAKGKLATLGLWTRPNALLAVRRGNPLHVAETAEGLYLATLASGLPGNAKEVADNSATAYSFKNTGALHVHVQTFASESSDNVSSYRGRGWHPRIGGEAEEYHGG
jgi:glucosamine--fructose-6-phosphate aminotransferase (isomerizing)